MELKIRFLKVSAGLPVAMLRKKTAERIGVNAKDRIFIKTISKPYEKISTILDVVENLIKENEIAVSEELKGILNLRDGQRVRVEIAPTPQSLLYIRKKLDNNPLSKKEIDEIIKDISINSLSEAEIALFVSAMYKNGMTMKETLSLIESISESGSELSFKEKFVVDKHSIGGIPGNRTTPIVVSICAAAGLIMPKTSSRAITSAAGTPDVVETITNVEFSAEEIKKIIKKVGACMVWGGALEIAPADSKIIAIEKTLEIDPEAQLLASIMSKKLAMGANYILIDIPYGKTAKVEKKQALRLKRKFEFIGKHFRKNLRVVLTDGSQPIGNGVGPVFEMRDIIAILERNQEVPKDLEKKSLFLAGNLLEMTGKAKKGKGFEKAKEILDSGKAFEKFKQIIEAQGGRIKKLKSGNLKKDILAKKSGRISEIDNKKINALARITGCPISKPSGIYFYHHSPDRVKKGDKLLTLYSTNKARLEEAIDFYNTNTPIKII